MARFGPSILFAFCLLSGGAHAQERDPKGWAEEMKANTPLQQTECEVTAKRALLAHPHMDSFKFMERYGTIPFGPASPPTQVPSYQDAESKIIFYAESDGRHLVALSANGRVLWVRNPFVDRNMCPYRTAHPFIARIGRPGGGVDMKDHHILTDAQANVVFVKELNDAISRGMKAPRPQKGARFISLGFNSSQMGLVDIRNGEFYFMGQN